MRNKPNIATLASITSRIQFEPLKTYRPRMSARQFKALWQKPFGKFTPSDICDLIMEAARARALEIKRINHDLLARAIRA